jgi:hypothetical protein
MLTGGNFDFIKQQSQHNALLHLFVFARYRYTVTVPDDLLAFISLTF